MRTGGETNADSHDLKLAFRIESACERFEAAWRAGERPDIRAFLAGFEVNEHAAIVRELIAIDVHWRRRAGEVPDLAGSLARFPASASGGSDGLYTANTEMTSPEIRSDQTFADSVVGFGEGVRRSNITAWPNLKDYEILGELGSGGMGVVYMARQTRLNRVVALKMILQGLQAGHEAVARFLGEATAVAKLQHPNIVQIFHIEEHDGHPYFEMEYVGGGTLASRLNGTPWSPREAARLVELLSCAMAEAHRQGVVHRDLKPSNILMTTENAPKVADFGLAKLLGADSGLTRTDSILGSPSYMSPEQADGKVREIGPASDIYALGAILYELLTGRPPFRGGTVLDTLQQVKTVEPVSPARLVPSLARDIETITLKCLHKEKEKRYPLGDGTGRGPPTLPGR